jgi:hypothetical protein
VSQLKRPVFAVVQNIPSPYRLHLFRVLQTELLARDWRLEVHFMAAGYGDRPHWLNPGALPFAHTYWRDLGVTVNGHKAHFNPGLLLHLWRTPPNCIMVGSPYDTLTSLLCPSVVRGARLLAWAEGNSQTPGRQSGLRASSVEDGCAVLEELLLPSVEEVGMDAGFLADLGDGNVVEKMALENGHLLLGRMASAALSGHGLPSDAFIP